MPVFPPAPCHPAQAGLTLLTSLVAMMLLALGVLGVLQVHLRLQVDARTAVSRSIALDLIDDLRERMLVNRDAALAGRYTLDWDDTVGPQDCTGAPCSGAQLAQADLAEWLTMVQNLLPDGQARVFSVPTSPQQIGIVLAWASNESRAAASDMRFLNPLSFAAALPGVPATGCPPQALCHLAYVQP